MDPLTPVIIGVGEVKNKHTDIAHAYEPAQLIVDALRQALSDTNLSESRADILTQSIDSISTVRPWTWPYPDLPGQIASRILLRGSDGLKHKECSEHGGNQPVRLLDEASRRVAKGQVTVAVVAGGEALASLAACSKAGKMPPPGWSTPDKRGESITVPSLSNGTRKAEQVQDNLGLRHGIGLPIHIYPLYENGYRARRKQRLKENHEESAQMYGQFAKVASKCEYAWNYGEPRKTSQEIAAVGKGRNRMICFPYPLLMNAFNTVNLAACCLITSAAYATELGVPRDRWVYPLGGAGTSESANFWERRSFSESPAIAMSIDATLELSGLQARDVDIFDFYSCFPIVPKLACGHVGLDILQPEKPITLLGGLTSFGGAGNNYSLHAVAAMTRVLRQGHVRRGLVLGNGGSLTYQHAICLSSQPRSAGRDTRYPAEHTLPDILPGIEQSLIDIQASGEAVIETYTVEFNRDGKPETGHLVGRLKSNGHRFIANHGDERTLTQLASTLEEQIGKSGWVYGDEITQKNVFTFQTERSKL
ncbi:thiolase [Xylariaceae sp. FL1272]|nr:thiolase [Xylariaceae sp. FL1272]